MYFIALATDYDGTLAHEGVVAEKTLAALERFKKSGRKLILVTGRELPDLKRVFPEIAIFDKVVAENGALIYTPASEEERAISPPPAPEFIAKLRKRGVKPLSVAARSSQPGNRIRLPRSRSSRNWGWSWKSSSTRARL